MVGFARSGSGEQRGCGGRDDGPATGQECPGVVKQHNAVAEQTPSLVGMADHHARGGAIRYQCVWAPGLVLAHIVLRHCELSHFIGQY